MQKKYNKKNKRQNYKLKYCPKCEDPIDSKIDYDHGKKIVYYICYNCNWNDYKEIK